MTGTKTGQERQGRQQSMGRRSHKREGARGISQSGRPVRAPGGLLRAGPPLRWGQNRKAGGTRSPASRSAMSRPVSDMHKAELESQNWRGTRGEDNSTREL